MIWEIALLALVLLIAGSLHGAIGLGFPLLATTSIALVLDLKMAVIITLLPTFIINLFSVLKGGRLRDLLSHYWPIMVFSMLGSLIGASFLLYLNQDLLKFFLALCILFYLVTNSKASAPKDQSPSLFFSVFMGLMAGIMGGAANAMSPLLVIYLLRISDKRTEIAQVANACFLLGKVSQAAILLPTVSFTDISPWLILGALGFAFIGLQVGFILQGKISQACYTKTVNLLLALIMLSLFVQVLYP
jgi:uncharacterized protein